MQTTSRLLLGRHFFLKVGNAPRRLGFYWKKEERRNPRRKNKASALKKILARLKKPG
jgi:transposase